MSRVVLKKNKEAIKMQIVTVGMLAMVVCILVSVFFSVLDALSSNVVTYILVSLWALSLVSWIIWAFVIYKRFSGIKYVLGENSVIIEKKGLFGRERNLYRYDSIQGISTRVNFLGSRHGFGSIILDIPHSPKQVILSNIEDVDNIASSIKHEVVSMSSSFRVSVDT